MKILSLFAGLLIIIALAACDTSATPTPSSIAPAQNTPAQNTPAQDTPAQDTPATGDADPTSPANPTDPTSVPVDDLPTTESKPPATSGATGLTTPIADPVFVFMPRQGGPGAIVNITGGNFTPGETIVVRIGIPDPIGEPLGSAQVGPDGMWNVSVTLPGTKPSGEAITTTDMNILAMDENNQILVSRPFRFIPAP